MINSGVARRARTPRHNFMIITEFGMLAAIRERFMPGLMDGKTAF
jgi:hypothetical protein